MNGKPSCPVLRGLGASNGARLLDNVEASTNMSDLLQVHLVFRRETAENFAR